LFSLSLGRADQRNSLDLTGGGDGSGGIVWIVGPHGAVFGARIRWRSWDGSGLRRVSLLPIAAPNDPVATPKVLVLAARINVADARIEYLN